MADRRRNREDPLAVVRFGWRYRHLGIPHSSPRDGEPHLKKLGVHVCGFETSPYGVEWMRFDTHCQVPETVATSCRSTGALWVTSNGAVTIDLEGRFKSHLPTFAK